MPYNSSLNLVIVLNGVGLPARILPGFLADRYLGILNTFSICVLANAIMLWAWLGVYNIPSFYAFTVIEGLVSASFQSLFPTTVAALSSDITKTGTRLGMAFALLAIAALVGGPISGALLRVGDGYLVPTCWAAGSAVVGMGLVWCARGVKHGWSLRTRC